MSSLEERRENILRSIKNERRRKGQIREVVTAPVVAEETLVPPPKIEVASHENPIVPEVFPVAVPILKEPPPQLPLYVPSYENGWQAHGTPASHTLAKTRRQSESLRRLFFSAQQSTRGKGTH
jgi:hypothetical protein